MLCYNKDRALSWYIYRATASECYATLSTRSDKIKFNEFSFMIGLEKDIADQRYGC